MKSTNNYYIKILIYKQYVKNNISLNKNNLQSEIRLILVMKMKCPICNHENNQIFIVKEMLQGFREEFEYIECYHCGCLFIKEIPENISKYYDINYAPHNHKPTIKTKIFDKLHGMYMANNIFAKLIRGKNAFITTKFWNELTSKGIITKDSAILDVGCGDGKFLDTLKKGGFKDLTGMDLFIDEENMRKGIKIFQSSLEDFNPKRKYDLIVSNHSFEHMDNQLENMKCFENLVKDDGIIVIRIPIKSQPIWEKYGVNWFQIDAPRHFFLHTVKSFKILCSKTNLVIDNIIFDSPDYTFISCEKYMRDISMRDPEWETFKLDNEIINNLKNEIRELNKKNEGDQAIFVLKLKNIMTN